MSLASESSIRPVMFLCLWADIANQYDILNSALLAQLGANFKHDRQTDAKGR